MEKKKLQLNKQTIAKLSGEELMNVRGGLINFVDYNNSVIVESSRAHCVSTQCKGKSNPCKDFKPMKKNSISFCNHTKQC